MILRKIGKRADFEAHSRQPVQPQRVGGNLHHHVIYARVRHHAQLILRHQRIRRGQLRGNGFIADHAAHRADQTHLMPRFLQNRFDQEAGGGFSLRAGDADQVHFPRGISVELGGDVGQCLAHIRHHHLRHVQIQHMIHHQRNRAVLHCLRCERVRVHHRTGRTYEQIACLYLARIDADVCDFSFRVSDDFKFIRNCTGQHIQLHSASPCILSRYGGSNATSTMLSGVTSSPASGDCDTASPLPSIRIFNP